MRVRTLSSFISSEASNRNTIAPNALIFISAIALIGSFYFLCIGVGYLIFSDILPEFRLRYVQAGVCAAVITFRGIVMFHYRLVPSKATALLYTLFGGLALIQGLWYLPILNGGGSEVYFSTIGETFVASGTLAITGESFGLLWLFGARKRLLCIAGASYVACVFTLGLGVQMGWNSTAQIRLKFTSETGDMVFNYLSLGDSIALLALFAMGIQRRTTVRLATFLVGATALFFAYSRTSFFLYIISSLFIFLIGGKHSQRLVMIASLAVIIATLIAVAGESDALQPAIDRMTVLLFNREADESFEARKVILSEGIEYLRENWLIGRFLDEWWREGVGGGYIHNWLSFWQAYGLIPFVSSVFLVIVSGNSIRRRISNPTEFTGTVASFWIYAVLAIITARAYIWPYFWFAFGLITCLAAEESEEGAQKMLKG